MDVIKEDSIAYLEMASIALNQMPDTLAEEMDISDEELIRLRNQLNDYMRAK